MQPLRMLTDRQAFATTMASGRIVRVLAQPGDRVSAGQGWPGSKSAEIVALQQEMLRASSELSLAEQLLKQRKKLGPALITGKLLLETQTTRDSKALELGIVRRKLHTIGVTTEQLDEVLASGRPLVSLAIRSPIAGIVSEADVRVGQMVEPTEHLYHVVDASRVWVVADVLETDSAAVKEGALAAVTFNAVPEQTFQGRIADIAIKMDPRRHVEQVRVLLENRDGRLQPGMFGQMRIFAMSQEQAIVCPTEALIRDGGRFVVLRAEGPGKFRRQSVQIGMRRPGQTEILDGLFPGDYVVTVGSQELATVFGGAAGRPTSPRLSELKSPSHSNEAMSSASSAAVLDLQAEVELPVGYKSFAAPTIRGKISRVLVERGERVRAGQVLAEADSIELRNLCLEFLQMRVQLAFTKTALERLELLRKQAAVPVQEIWSMRSKHDTYHHAMQSQTAARTGRSCGEGNREAGKDRVEGFGNRQHCRRRVADSRPADGWVADFHLAIGQVVAANEQLFEIQDLSQVWIKAFAFERDLPRIRLGETLQVRIVADSTFEASATVSRLSPVLASTGRVLYFWAELANPDHRLKEGMLATATVNAVASEGGAVARRSARPRDSKQ